MDASRDRIRELMPESMLTTIYLRRRLARRGRLIVQSVARKTKKSLQEQDIVILIHHHWHRTLPTSSEAVCFSACSARLHVRDHGLLPYSQARGIIRFTQSRGINSKKFKMNSHLYSCYNRLPCVGHLRCRIAQPEPASKLFPVPSFEISVATQHRRAASGFATLLVPSSKSKTC